MSLLKKYDTVQGDVFRFIWNRLTVSNDRSIEEVLAVEIAQRYPTWIMFNDVPKSMQKDIALCLIRQAKFYRSEVFKFEVSGSEMLPEIPTETAIPCDSQAVNS